MAGEEVPHVWASSWDDHATLRSLLLHLIHEYARHNEQADLLREAVDGVTGA